MNTSSSAPTGVPSSSPPTVVPSPGPTVSFVPTVFPSPSPTLSSIGKANSWKYIIFIMKWYAVLFAAQLLLFELFRADGFVYGSRLKVYGERCPGRRPPRRPWWPLGWVWPVLSVPDQQLLSFVGLDMYVMTRILKLCWKLCAVATVVCCAILAPVYASGSMVTSDDDTVCPEASLSSTDDCQQELFNLYTLANVLAPDTDGDADSGSNGRQLWIVGVIAAYGLTAHLCVLIREELRHFRDLRVAFLVRGDSQVNRQSLYTVMVDRIPYRYRSNVAFRRLFDQLFPGQVHSTEVMQDLRSLAQAVERARYCVEQYESASLAASLTGKRRRIFLGPWWGRLPWWEREEWWKDAVGHWEEQLAQANRAMAEQQKGVLQSALRSEHSANRMLLKCGAAMDADIRASAIIPHSGDDPGAPYQRSVPPPPPPPPPPPSSSSSSPASCQPRAMAAQGDSSSSSEPAPAGGRDAEEARKFHSKTGLTERLWTTEPRAGTSFCAGAPFCPFTTDDRVRFYLYAGTRDVDEQGGLLAAGPDSLAGSSLPLGMRATGWERWTLPFADAGPRSHSLGSGHGSFLREVLNAAGAKTKSCMLDLARFLSGSSGTHGSLGFVTFRSLSAATAAAQLTMSHKALTLRTRLAPEPRDIIWENVMATSTQTSVNVFVASVVLNIGAVFFAALVASFALLANPSYLYADGRQVGAVAWLKLTDKQLAQASAYVPALCGLGLLLVVPWVFLVIAVVFEGYKQKAEIEVSIFRRYFNYYLAYIWITSITFSVSTTVEGLVKGDISKLSDLLSLIALSVPKASGYFITVLVLKIFFGTMWELARPWALLSKSVQRCITPDALVGPWVRQRTRVPDPCRFGWVYPQLLLVMAIALIYQVITPLIAPFGLVYFSLAYLVFKHQALYVYVNDYESGGRFLTLILRRTLITTAGAHILLNLYFLCMQNVAGFCLTLPLPFLTLYFKDLVFAAYEPMLPHLPFDVAVHVDQMLDYDRRMRGGGEGKGEDEGEGEGEGEGGSSARVSDFRDKFDATLYMQPWLAQPRFRSRLPKTAVPPRRAPSAATQRKAWWWRPRDPMEESASPMIAPGHSEDDGAVVVVGEAVGPSGKHRSASSVPAGGMGGGEGDLDPSPQLDIERQEANLDGDGGRYSDADRAGAAQEGSAAEEESLARHRTMLVHAVLHPYQYERHDPWVEQSETATARAGAHAASSASRPRADPSHAGVPAPARRSSALSAASFDNCGAEVGPHDTAAADPRPKEAEACVPHRARAATFGTESLVHPRGARHSPGATASFHFMDDFATAWDAIAGLDTDFGGTLDVDSTTGRSPFLDAGLVQTSLAPGGVRRRRGHEDGRRNHEQKRDSFGQSRDEEAGSAGRDGGVVSPLRSEEG